MSAKSSVGPVTRYLLERLTRLLDEHRVVVWYDSAGAFRDLAGKSGIPNCVRISSVGSALQSRRTADEAYRALEGAGQAGEPRPNLLVYLPVARGKTREGRLDDPFEGFGRCGAFFGDQESESLMSLAISALPVLADEIERLFREGRPTLELLDGLGSGPGYPLVRQALGTESPSEALVAALAAPDAAARLGAVPGSMVELARLAETAVGLPLVEGEEWRALRERLGSYILVTELAGDLPSKLPAQLETVPHAIGEQAKRAMELCRRLRDSEIGRDVYLGMATVSEKQLQLEALLKPGIALGTVDTFPIEERLRLQAIVTSAVAGDLVRAREMHASAAVSIWRREAERLILWNAVQRCLAFLEESERAESTTLPSSVAALVAVYTEDDGLWRLDRSQRLFEQAGAQCLQDDEVEPLIQLCRGRYRSVLGRVQDAFQTAVAREGWPPEGIRRQTQLFDLYVAPELAESRKTAYFLVDSLRYEMGRDLAEALGSLGAAQVESAANVLPASTPFGMAALMPGADGSFSMAESGGNLVPSVAGTPLAGVVERKALLSGRYGDRVIDITLDELLSVPTKRLGKKLGTADLVVVRSQDIDLLGEHVGQFRARKAMSDVIGELRSASSRLADLGYTSIVMVSDHGHLLLPESLPGDVVSAPPGEWKLSKRRSLLGRSRGKSAGVIVLPAEKVGISGPVEEFAAATGVRTFQAGAGYFHEGLSLQECIVPVVRLRAKPTASVGAGDQVTISYRSDRFTSSVIGLKLRLESVVSPSVSIKLEGYGAAVSRGQSVTEAGDCDALDQATKEVVLKNGVDTQVPLLVSPDFEGEQLEVRAIDPRTGATLASLTLKNARMV